MKVFIVEKSVGTYPAPQRLRAGGIPPAFSRFASSASRFVFSASLLVVGFVVGMAGIVFLSLAFLAYLLLAMVFMPRVTDVVYSFE